MRYRFAGGTAFPAFACASMSTTSSVLLLGVSSGMLSFLLIGGRLGRHRAGGVLPTASIEGCSSGELFRQPATRWTRKNSEGLSSRRTASCLETSAPKSRRWRKNADAEHLAVRE